ncbi:unnamed protein product [Urochloa humidicola]
MDGGAVALAGVPRRVYAPRCVSTPPRRPGVSSASCGAWNCWFSGSGGAKIKSKGVTMIELLAKASALALA